MVFLEDGQILQGFSKILVALPVVIILVFISLKLSRNYLYKMTKNNTIKVLERVPMHNKTTLNLVQIVDDYYVLGVTENNISVIKKIEETEKQNIIEKKRIN